MGIFDDLVKQAKNLDGLQIELTESDTVDSVARKIKAELKRKKALDLDSATIRGLARDMLKKARS